jgi:hypothetical protein
MKVPSNVLDEDSLEILDNLYDKDLDFNIDEDILLNADLDNFSLSISEIY